MGGGEEVVNGGGAGMIGSAGGFVGGGGGGIARNGGGDAGGVKLTLRAAGDRMIYLFWMYPVNLPTQGTQAFTIDLVDSCGLYTNL